MITGLLLLVAGSSFARNGTLVESDGWKVANHVSMAEPANLGGVPRGLRLKMGHHTFTETDTTRLFSFSGQPFYGDVTQPYTNTPIVWPNRGYNLIANPYPSAIDWEKMWDDVDTAQVRNEFFIYNSSFLQYGFYDGVNDFGTLGTTRLIPSSQSFFMRVRNATDNSINQGNLTISESHKADAIPLVNSGNFLRTSSDDPKNTVQRRENTLWARLNSSPFQGGDECVLIFRPGADQLFVDTEDGESPPDGNANFKTISDNEVTCSVNVYPAFFFNWQVKCRFKAPGGSTYTVRIDSLESFPVGSRFFLQDKKAPNGATTRDSIQDLLVSNTYSFRYDGANVADNNRFVLHCIAPNVAVKPELESGSHSAPLQAFLFPNPASTRLTVKLQNHRGVGRYRVVSSTGAVAMQGKAEGSSFSLDVSNLPKGIYLVRVEENGRSVTRRFVKE